MLEQVVEGLVRVDIAAQFDLDAHAALVGVVLDIGDAVELLLLGELGDGADEVSLVDLVGDFGDDDGGFATFDRFNHRLGLHDDASTAGFVGFADTLGAHDEAVGGEVRTGHVLHQLFEGGVGVIDAEENGVCDFGEVVGGMDVAMPTAMPWPPLQRRFGNLPGRTVGSFALWR